MSIKTPERELDLFAKAKKSDNVKYLPPVLDIGFRNNVNFDQGFDIVATVKIRKKDNTESQIIVHEKFSCL